MAHNPLAASIKVVIVNGALRDPALADDMDFKAYVETRDPSLIKCKPGRTPTYFHLKPLKRLFVVDQIDTLAHWSQQFRLAFNAACHRVELPGEPALVVGEDDWASEPGATPRIAGDGWIEDTLADIHLDAIYEIGSAALKRTRVPRKALTPLSSPPSSEPTASSAPSE